VAELKGVEKEGGKTGKTSPVTLLDFELSTGNSSTLFDHGGQMDFRKIEPDRVALNLLTFQNFSSGGGLPVAQWNKTRTSQVGNPDAPCLSQSMAHCIFRGKALAGTIHLNLPYFENIAKVYRCFSTDRKKGDTYTNVPFGKPVWEFFPDLPDIESEKATNATQTYLGRLVPISRWIRIIEGTNQMYCCNGFKYHTFKDGFAAEPTGSVRIVKFKDKKGIDIKERKVVGMHPLRAAWRELSALLIKRHADGIGGPLAMETAPCDTEFDFQVCAIIRDQASMEIAVESVFNVSPVLQSNLPVYRSEVEFADSLSWILRKAIETYRVSIDNDWSPRIKREQAKNQSAIKDRLAQSSFLSYWTTVEKNLSLLMTHIESIGTDAAVPTRQVWRNMLFAAARDSYRIACGKETPRQMRAFAKGWQELTSNKDERKLDSP
jgi:CRISPR system Cascade subunit CasA